MDPNQSLPLLSEADNFNSQDNTIYASCSVFFNSSKLHLQSHRREKLSDRELIQIIFKNLFHGKITYLHSGKGVEMSPTMAAHENTLLVRKIPIANTR